MSSSLLQQAVALAQQGQRDEAARLLRQFVDTNPDHEVAWLWLASVAANQPEYVSALNEVLRINPANARARQLLDEFNQQYGPLPVTTAGTAPLPRRATPPAFAPTDIAGAPGMRPIATPYPSTPPYGAEPVQPPSQVRYEREVIVKRRGCVPGCLPLPGCSIGCGCWQPCLVLVVVAIVLPLIACGALATTTTTLGPLDWPAAYLPERLGRKTIDMTVDGYKVELSVRRSWQVAEDQNEWWELGREILTESMPFDEPGQTWFDFEAPVGKADTVLETDPIALARGGDKIGLKYNGTETGSFTCDDVRARSADFDDYVTYANDLCGWRKNTIEPWVGVKLSGVEPPDQTRRVEFRVPVNESTALVWHIFLPENMASSYKTDIDALIESVKIVGSTAG